MLTTAKWPTWLPLNSKCVYRKLCVRCTTINIVLRTGRYNLSTQCVRLRVCVCVWSHYTMCWGACWMLQGWLQRTREEKKKSSGVWINYRDCRQPEFSFSCRQTEQRLKCSAGERVYLGCFVSCCLCMIEDWNSDFTSAHWIFFFSHLVVSAYFFSFCYLASHDWHDWI